MDNISGQDAVQGKVSKLDKDKKLSNATPKHIALAIISWLVCFSAAHATGQAKICAQRVAFNSSDYTQEYEYGPIIVPERAVFEWAGHSFAGPEDIRDTLHMASDPESERTWPSIPIAEEKRRHELTQEDTAPRHPLTTIITLKEATLTYSHPCALVPVSLFVTNDWGEEGKTINPDNIIVYQADGVWGNDHILTEEGTPKSFEANVQSGNINAIITRPVTEYFPAYSKEMQSGK